MNKKSAIFARLESVFQSLINNGLLLTLKYLFQIGLVKAGIRNYMVLENGHKIYLRPNTSDLPVFRQMFFQHEYDLDFKNVKVKNIIDAGSNIGLAAVYLKQMFKDAKVVSIEPDNSNFEQLKKNTAPLSNMNYENAGVWDKEAFLKVNFSNDLGEWGIFVTEVENEKDASVKGVSFDQLLQKYQMDTVDLMKIDIESAEKIIFSKDCSSWLKKCKIIAVELHDNITPGCSQTFFSNIDGVLNYDMALHGEYVVIYNKDLI